MTLPNADDVEAAAADDDHALTKGKLESARRERDALKRTNGRLEAEIAKLHEHLAIRDAVHGMVLNPPKWQVRKPRSSKAARYHSTAWLHLSDWHFDEVVQPELMNGLNAYNRSIGEQRLRRWAENVVQVATIQAASFDWDGAVLSINGDIFSGWIHGLKDSNEGDGLFKDVRHWATHIVAAVELILTVFPNVAIYSTVGNHGRLSERWDSKHAVSENVEYLLGLTLVDWFASDSRVDVTVAESVDLLFPIYDLRILQTHGNTGGGNGGSGLAGFWPRLARMQLAKQSLYKSQGGFDVMGCGHFHQYKPTAVGYSGFVVNGAGKGFDDYARDAGFAAEPAVQAFVQIAPERGVTAHYPIFVADQKAEGW